MGISTRRSTPAADARTGRRAGTADEVAQAITWLTSNEASFVTGTFIDVAGGV